MKVALAVPDRYGRGIEKRVWDARDRLTVIWPDKLIMGVYFDLIIVPRAELHSEYEARRFYTWAREVLPPRLAKDGKIVDL
jgi:hypothetical protein